MDDKNQRSNLEQSYYDKFDFAINLYDLNELETKWLYLETTVAHYRCNSFNWKPPQLKTNNYYLTNDGYKLKFYKE